MEDEQNLQKNTGKGTQAKPSKKYWQTTDTGMKKYKTYQYIVEATQMLKVTSTNTSQYQ